jgi:hypothetical protein
LESTPPSELFLLYKVFCLSAAYSTHHYALLGKADAAGDATLFVEFMVEILKQALVKAITMEVTVEAKRVIRIMNGEMKRKQIQGALELKNDDHFRSVKA